jgi:nitroimidazol reductase NimA-like FMN-containing flavoprotein (pyridoxamine 5'-phosphate oxidase superfamily)
MEVEYPRSERTTATRHSDRVTYDRAAVHAVLDEGLTCHVGYVVDGQPVVLPQLHARVGETLYLHGSSGARALREARGDGLEVCVTVTLVDGVVLARSAFNHSMNYRSVVVRGSAQVVTDEAEKQDALAALVDAIVPGRSAEVRGPSRKELVATTVLRLPLRDVSLKVRSGPPVDEDTDLDLPYWAGVVPTALTSADPEPAPGLSAALTLPTHVSSWTPSRKG